MKNVAFAQKQQTVLKGYLGVEGGESYTYKLVFTDSSGFIKGHSYTYLYETKEVKTTIHGFIDRNYKTLSFKETDIVYNHGFESNTTICLINAVLKHNIGSDGKDLYQGSIISSDLNNVYCGKGTVTFPYTEDLKKVFTNNIPIEIPAKPTVSNIPPKPVKIIYDTANTRWIKHEPETRKKNEPEKITAGTEKIIEWYSDTLIIELWDGGKVDGDIISVTCNGESLVKNLTLNKEHKRLIKLLGKDAVSEIIFTANHEGNEPPMTANVMLIDRFRKHSIIVYNHVGRMAKIKLRKVTQ